LFSILSFTFPSEKTGFLCFQNLQLEKWLRIGYNPFVFARQILKQEVGKMFFFNCNTNNSDCSSIWQLLSRMCGFGC